MLPRISDIARLAGTSTATVDRVLNERGGVRRATVERVLAAANQLEYLPKDSLLKVLAPPAMRLLFVLPERSSRYLTMLADWIRFSREHWAPFNVDCRVATVPAFDAAALAQLLVRRGRNCDGVAFMALEHPAVHSAVQKLADDGIPTLTVVSDLPASARVAYVGLDNHAAGRTAAWLIARFIAGRPDSKVAMIAGSLAYRAHGEREAGFKQLFASDYPRIRLVGLREGYDDARSNHRQTRALLDQHPDLSAIYNFGGGAEGIGQALRESGRQHHVVFIGHGLTPDTRALLIDGTMDAVINQSPHSAVMNCVRIFTNLRERREPLSGIEAMRSLVFFRENLP